MILEEAFSHFTFWDAIESGLYFIIVGYYFLLFAYFIIMRFRENKKIYWLFFSLVFLFLAAGRVFFIIYYFFIPEMGLADPIVLANMYMLFFRLATFCTWMAVACLMGVLGILLFPPDVKIEIKGDIEKPAEKKKISLTPQMKIGLRIILFALPIVVGIIALALPESLLMDPGFMNPTDEAYIPGLNVELITIDIGTWSYPAGRFALNLVLLPILIFIIPFLFIYLAVKTFGVIRQSYALNAVGFSLYFAGRAAQGLFESFGLPHMGATIPPLLILLSMIVLFIASNYEHLK